MESSVLANKSLVEDLLLGDPRCAENDTWLIFQFWKRKGWDFGITFEQVLEMPIPESIRRPRQLIHNREKKREQMDPGYKSPLLPSDEVLANRGTAEENMDHVNNGWKQVAGKDIQDELERLNGLSKPKTTVW